MGSIPPSVLDLVSPEHGSERAKYNFFTRDSEAHIVVEAELLLCPLKQELELRVAQERDGNNVSGPVYTDIDSEVAFWNIKRKAIFVIPVFFPQA